jgi:tetratricopeptide (TPR) repeat protein
MYSALAIMRANDCRVTPLQNIQDLYDHHRFLEAYQQSSSCWTPATDIAGLLPNELILAGRLAARLGGSRLSRWLLRAAYERDPDSPRVLYFTRHVRQRARHLLDDLRAFELQPDLGGDDPDLRASWLASHAVTWASLRDFSRAQQCIERARCFATRDGWVLSCESDVLGLADRWDEALKAAELSWQASQGAPFAASSLGNSLLNLGRVEESAGRLAAAAEKGESYEIAHLTCWHQCALAETLEGRERHRALDRARELAQKLPLLAPLADRETKSQFARIQLDIAELLDDHAEMERWAEEVRSPVYRKVLANLHKNPGGRRIRLPFRRAIQKHDTCLPASLSSALAAMGVPIEADAMAAEITYGGTSFWAAAEWLEKLGLTVRFFPVTPDVATRVIKNHVAFVMSLQADDSAHAVAVVGLDEAAGTLLVHDPQAFRTCEYLLESIGQHQAPLGPEGIVAIPKDQVTLLDQLLPSADAEVMAAIHRRYRAAALIGPSAARGITHEVSQQHPVHPGTRFLTAIQAADDGHTGEALACFQELLKAFPNSRAVRSRLLAACRSLGNTALMRDVLAGVVECGMLPGIQSRQDWLYPPVPYVCEYADLLRVSASSRRHARSLLNSVFAQQFTSASAWHILGDLLWHEHDINGRLLAFRIASCLADSNEHYARAYCDALSEAGREEEGLAWLEARVRRFGASPVAVEAWITWIGALEHWGHPEQALAACDEATQQHGGIPALLAFTIPFRARMGLWKEAEKGLRQLETGGNLAFFYEAAVDFHRMRGALDPAITCAEAWVRESPQSIAARRQLLDLTAKRSGDVTALSLAARWSAEHRGHDIFEELYYEQLGNAHPNWKRDALLYRRVKRNAEDGWAWRELTFRRLNDYDSADRRRQEKLHERIVKLLAQCDRTAPEDPATLRAHALWYEVRGQWSEAVAAWLKAIDADPGSFYSYRHVWDCSAAFDDAERHNIFQQIEPMLLSCPGRLSIARDMIFLLARRFGVVAAEEAALRWKAKRPDDPDVIEAAADLLLEYGHGRSDAIRALAMLEPAVQHFPYHAGLRFSLANALRGLGRLAEAEETFREIIRRHPDNIAVNIQLAWVHERHGNGEEALRLLQSAGDRDPLNAEFWDARARILIRTGRFSEARAAIQQGLQRLPQSVHWREKSVALLFECGDEEGAVATAREGVRVYPRGAYLWYLLATTLKRAVRFAAQGEIESCFRRSLSFNSTLFGAADYLAMLLVEQRRYGEAEEIMVRIMPRLCDPSAAQGRVAWIHREQGRKDETLDEMAAVLRAAPWYGWGWRVLMDWLVEDEAWERARNLLRVIPPELRTETHFRKQRLLVLAKAGLPPDELDAEWNSLLRDFPEDVPLHLERYDSLRTEDRVSESRELLDVIRPLDPDSPYVLARLAEVLAEQNKKDEAIENLLRVWFAEVEESSWPADHAWEAMRKADLDDEAYRRARRLLDEGSRPTPKALSLMATHAMHRENAGKKTRQPFWRTWFPGAGAREVLSLLERVDRSVWSEGRYRAELLRHLCDSGYRRSVISYWKKNRTLVEADVGPWSQVGRVLVDLGRKREARDLLSDWRKRSGVAMWAVTNYVLSFSRISRKNSQAVLSVCTDALVGLPHDHCAKFLAHVAAEMCAVRGDVEAFRAAWTRNRNYFSRELENSEWFETSRRHLLDDIPDMARLLEKDQLKQFRNACRKLRWKQIVSPLLDNNGMNNLSLGGQSGKAVRLRWWYWFILLWFLFQFLRIVIESGQR